ncbi:MAG: hypothetical protein PHF17_06000 [Arcobacteraceae bacterium]|nr:hypothetical protein [Arcobacteraceae bacterium]
MNNKEQLIDNWKRLRGSYFIKYEEDAERFKRYHSQDPLFESVYRHLDKSFREINQIAQDEIEIYLKRDIKNIC